MGWDGVGGTHQRPAVDLDEHGTGIRVVGASLADAAGPGAPEGAQGRGAQLRAQQLLHGAGGGMGDGRHGDTGDLGPRRQRARTRARRCRGSCPWWRRRSVRPKGSQRPGVRPPGLPLAGG